VDQRLRVESSRVESSRRRGGGLVDQRHFSLFSSRSLSLHFPFAAFAAAFLFLDIPFFFFPQLVLIQRLSRRRFGGFRHPFPSSNVPFPFSHPPFPFPVLSPFPPFSLSLSLFPFPRSFFSRSSVRRFSFVRNV